MNEKRFDGKADIYAKARPGYAPELLTFLKENVLVGSDSSAADIGSGTGIFTEQLARLVKTVYAVEPNRDMRKEADPVFAKYDNIISIAAAAENTSLENSSVDFVTVAQAFHWFDRAAFRKECQRILKPNGTVILIWNDRDDSSAVIKENYALNKEYCPDFKGSSNGTDFKNISFDGFFSGEIQVKFFDNIMQYDKNAFINRNLSSSYAPKEGEANYLVYIQKLEELFERLSSNGQIPYPYITRCYIGKV